MPIGDEKLGEAAQELSHIIRLVNLVISPIFSLEWPCFYFPSRGFVGYVRNADGLVTVGLFTYILKCAFISSC
jgi:hypothetical protein